MCDPNDQGAPPRSPLEVAIRRDEAHLVELLQHQANPQLRELGQELPIIVAASRARFVASRSSCRMDRTLRNRVFAIG